MRISISENRLIGKLSAVRAGVSKAITS